MGRFITSWRKVKEADAREDLMKEGVNRVLNEPLRQRMSTELERKYGLSRSIPDPKQTRKISWTPIIAVAASVLVLLLLIPNLFKTADVQQLATEFIAHDRLVHPGVTKGESPQSQAYELAIASFNEGNFSKSVGHFKEIEAPSISDQFYLATALLYGHNFEEAVTRFAELRALSESTYREEVNWFLALALVKSGREKEAVTVLKQIKSGEWQADKAFELLNQLSN